MSNWVICTRKSDEEPIYPHLDTVERMRWNEAGDGTIVVWPGGKDNFVKVLQGPEEILINEDRGAMESKKRSRPKTAV